jgi:hypothetical protein
MRYSGDNVVTVVLDLVDPSRTGRWFMHGSAKLGCYLRTRRIALTILAPLSRPVHRLRQRPVSPSRTALRGSGPDDAALPGWARHFHQCPPAVFGRDRFPNLIAAWLRRGAARRNNNESNQQRSSHAHAFALSGTTLSALPCDGAGGCAPGASAAHSAAAIAVSLVRHSPSMRPLR